MPPPFRRVGMEGLPFVPALAGWLSSLGLGPEGLLASIVSGALPHAPAVPAAAQDTEHAPRQKRRTFVFRRQRGPQQLFSCQLRVHAPAQQAEVQELITTGSKIWGIGSALPIAKLYEFAVYINRQQVQRSRLASQFGQQLAVAPRQEAFYHSLRASADIDFSLVVRASRNLPIRLVAAEYRRILRSRLAALGHDPGDAGLATMLEAFSEERLPSSIKQGSSVVKGTVLMFNKHKDGVLVAHADGQPIARVHSPPLCEAVMDVYLGPKAPVSRKARRVAGDSLVRMIGGDPASSASTGLACSLEQHICKLGA